MSDTKITSDTLSDILRPVPESQNPEYLAWKAAKIKQALTSAKASPEKRIPQRKIWKKFGLEY
jgi:hypothetical protein